MGKHKAPCRDCHTGEETTLVTGLECEDAHRVACQQWISRGRRIIFHDLRDGEVVVVTVDPQSKEQRVLAKHRMVSFGQQNSDLVPIYGVHFQPDQYRNVELLNAATGEIRTLVTADAVRAAYPKQIEGLYGQHLISTPFGTISPDLKLIFFKLSDVDPTYKSLPPGHLKWPHSYQSDREGLVVFDVEHSRLVFFQRDWGHPAWFPDSRRILNFITPSPTRTTESRVPFPTCLNFPASILRRAPMASCLSPTLTLSLLAAREASGAWLCATRMETTGRGLRSLKAIKARPRGARITLIPPSVLMAGGFTTT